MKQINLYISLNEKISSLDDYIQEKLYHHQVDEKLVITKDTKEKQQVYTYHPKSGSELKELVDKLIKERGNKADLNDIDTSEITDMNGVFDNSTFNGDISKWDVSKVEDMSFMFYKSKFTGKNGGISNWDVSNVKYMYEMFSCSPLEKNPPKWYKK